MRAVLQTAPGGVDTLYLGETALPEPGPGQVLVEVAAAGINRADIVQREGRYPPPPGAPAILGLEIAGTIALAPAGSRFKPGDAVFGLVAGGGYAEFALLDEALAIPKPDWLSWVEAASLPEAWMTAWFNLIEIGRLRAGQNVLIHAGASGVGAAAIQLAASFGARAFATAGSSAKLAFCESLGAWLAINYRETREFADLVKAQGGVDLILDPVGQAYFEQNLACLNQDGKLVLIGVMSGVDAQLNLGRLLVKRHTVVGSTLRSQPLEVKALLARELEENVLPWLASHQVVTTVDRTFAFEQVADAHRHVERNENLGKVVLVMKT
jgi:NADPH2:quinone reductase